MWKQGKVLMTKASTHSLETISKLLDLSPRRVQQLSKEGVIPKAERGRYQLVPAVRGYINYLRERTLNPNVISFEEVRAKKLSAEAELTVIELREKKGELVQLQEVVESWVEIIGACKTRMLSIPAKLAPIVAVENTPAICKDLIDEQINEALSELAQWVNNEYTSQDADAQRIDGVETTAETDCEPMG